jgi:hypothetical protein
VSVVVEEEELEVEGEEVEAEEMLKRMGIEVVEELEGDGTLTPRRPGVAPLLSWAV